LHRKGLIIGKLGREHILRASKPSEKSLSKEVTIRFRGFARRLNHQSAPHTKNKHSKNGGFEKRKKFFNDFWIMIKGTEGVDGTGAVEDSAKGSLVSNTWPLAGQIETRVWN